MAMSKEQFVSFHGASNRKVFYANYARALSTRSQVRSGGESTQKRFPGGKSFNLRRKSDDRRYSTDRPWGISRMVFPSDPIVGRESSNQVGREGSIPWRFRQEVTSKKNIADMGEAGVFSASFVFRSMTFGRSTLHRNPCRNRHRT